MINDLYLYTPEPWRWVGWTDFFDHWQALLAGLLGFIAAILVVWMTLNSERRKRQHELEAIRRSIGVEIRQIVLAVFAAYPSFKNMAQNPNNLITAQMIGSYWYSVEPIIYRASADKIGLLGSDAMDVVMLYRLAEIIHGAIERLLRYQTPNQIPHILITDLADNLRKFCKAAAPIIPRLKTNVPKIDKRDEDLLKNIAAL